MDLFLTILFLFAVGSTFGWTIELIYRRFFSAKKWLNPGFLVGPYLPLYGFGLCLLYLLASIDLSFIPARIPREVLTILIMGLAMTLIEYLAGLIFIVGMKIELWDYSDRWGNIQGIICPQFSVYWTILGAAYRFLFHPFFHGTVIWLFDHFTFIFVVGMFYGILLVDVVWSFRLMARIRTFAKERHIVVRLEEFKKSIAEHAEKNRFWQFIVALQERSRSTAESLQDYFESLRRRTGERIRKTYRRASADGQPDTLPATTDALTEVTAEQTDIPARDTPEDTKGED